MIETVTIPPRRDAWTKFWDMHSGGGTKVGSYDTIYIQASEDEARRLFEERFGRSPDHVSCSCCGEDYSVSEYDTLAEATAFRRNAEIADDGSEVVSRYTYPGSNNKPRGRLIPLDEYLGQPDVLVLFVREGERQQPTYLTLEPKALPNGGEA